jgi:hypothetical protein
MAYSRNSRRPIFLNNNQEYRDSFFRQRDIKETFQYEVSRIAFPTPQFINSLTNVTLVWGATDTLYNISQQYYGSPQYWWVVAWYNQRASEPEFEAGDIYYVPLPLEDVLGFFG